MPEICRFYGIIIQMFFNDHNPPHFHAVYGEYKIVININDEVVEGFMPKRALKLVSSGWKFINLNYLKIGFFHKTESYLKKLNL